MPFDPRRYGPEVAAILALDGAGDRLMPLAEGACSSDEARQRIQTRGAASLFPASRAPEAALGGLYLYFSCLEDAHLVAQKLATPEGSFWHGIMHRQEPDPSNAEYWFRRVGSHPVFPELRQAAAELVRRYPKANIRVAEAWDPVWFVELCEEARCRPGSVLEQAAREIQRAEWQLLFDYCAHEAQR